MDETGWDGVGWDGAGWDHAEKQIPGGDDNKGTTDSSLLSFLEGICFFVAGTD